MLQYTYELSPSLLFENGKPAVFIPVTPDQGGYYNVGTGATWKWTTYARQMQVESYATVARKVAIRVTVDGTCRDYYFGGTTVGQFNTTNISLPAGNKTIELIVPGQHASSAGGVPGGVFPTRISLDSPATAITSSVAANRVVIYGDSITVGGNAICEAHLGFGGLMKKTPAFGGYDGDVTLVAYGFRRLFDDCSTAGARTSFVTSLLALNPTVLVLFIGSNDQAVIPPTSNANFQIYYEGLLDEIALQDSSLKVLCVSPLLRGFGSEVANSLGETMPQKRTIIANAVAARSGAVTPPVYLDGSTIIGYADLDDGTHPTTAAHVIIRDAMLSAIAAL